MLAVQAAGATPPRTESAGVEKRPQSLGAGGQLASAEALSVGCGSALSGAGVVQNRLHEAAGTASFALSARTLLTTGSSWASASSLTSSSLRVSPTYCLAATSVSMKLFALYGTLATTRPGPAPCHGASVGTGYLAIQMLTIGMGASSGPRRALSLHPACWLASIARHGTIIPSRIGRGSVRRLSCSTSWITATTVAGSPQALAQNPSSDRSRAAR